MPNDMDRNEMQGQSDEARISTRRTLLGAAGGFALAASGLLVPGRLVEEAEAADNHPVRGLQQRKNQRRRKARNKHKKHHRRNHGKKKVSSSFALIDGIWWAYYSGDWPFDVQLWTRINAGRNWGVADSQHVPIGHPVDFKTQDVIGILWINNRYFFRAENFLGAVHLSLGYGGSFGSNHGWENGTSFLTDYNLPTNQKAPEMIVDGFKFVVGRSDDDDDYKKLNLTITKA